MLKYDPGVYIAIPNYRGTVVQGLAGWLFSVEGSTGEKIMLDMHSQQPVDACRNKLVTRFLKKSNLEWMLFIDDDIVPWPTLLNMRELGLPVVSALTYTKKGGVPIACAAISRHENMVRFGGIGENQDKPVEVVGVGGGALMIHRSVLETIKPPWFRFTYKDNGQTAQGEDIYFSQKAIKAGFKLHVDTTCPCGHVHLADIREEAARIAVALTSGNPQEFHEKMGFPVSAKQLKEKAAG